MTDSISVTTALGISTFASLLAVGILWVSRLVWSVWVENLWLGLTCKHIRKIGAYWTCNLRDGHTEVWRLKQSGWRVNGTIDYSIDGEPTKAFTVQGIVRSNYFTGTYWSEKTDEMSIGSFTFEIQNDNDKLVGTYAGYNPAKSCINSVDCTLEKQDSQQHAGQVSPKAAQSASPNEP